MSDSIVVRHAPSGDYFYLLSVTDGQARVHRPVYLADEHRLAAEELDYVEPIDVYSAGMEIEVVTRGLSVSGRRARVTSVRSSLLYVECVSDDRFDTIHFWHCHPVGMPMRRVGAPARPQQLSLF